VSLLNLLGQRPRVSVPGLFASLRLVHIRLEKILTNQTEHAAALGALAAQVAKTRDETLAKIAELEAAIANAGSTTPEVDAALEALRAQVQASDDVIPDAV
jgi:predicted negative regulator of RcsB-dependent stress response